MVIMKVQQLRSLTDCSDKKRTTEFVGEIHIMIDNDPNKSVRSITKDMGESEFLIRQVVHKDRWYFSYKIRKGQILSKVVKDKKKDHAVLLSKNLKHPL